MLSVSALKIHVSPCTKELLDDYYTFVLELRGPVAMKVVLFIITRPRRSTTYVDASCCYRPSSMVCLSSEPCKVQKRLN